MKQYFLYVFDEFSHNSAKLPDADNKCVHTLPCSKFASLEKLYIVHNHNRDILSFSFQKGIYEWDKTLVFYRFFVASAPVVTNH